MKKKKISRVISKNAINKEIVNNVIIPKNILDVRAVTLLKPVPKLVAPKNPALIPVIRIPKIAPKMAQNKK